MDPDSSKVGPSAKCYAFEEEICSMSFGSIPNLKQNQLPKFYVYPLISEGSLTLNFEQNLHLQNLKLHTKAVIYSPRLLIVDHSILYFLMATGIWLKNFLSVTIHHRGWYLHWRTSNMPCFWQLQQLRCYYFTVLSIWAGETCASRWCLKSYVNPWNINI